MSADPGFTRLARELPTGVHNAEELVPVLYDDLHRMAANFLRGERQGHTLQPTALINEAYLRLVKQEDMTWQNRAHFLAWASHTMRQVLLNYARDRRAQKRGGGRDRVPIDDILVSFEKRSIDLEALDEALERLAEADAQRGRIVELRFFGGLTHNEVAEVLGVSVDTIERQWRFARAWLHREVQKGEH